MIKHMNIFLIEFVQATEMCFVRILITTKWILYCSENAKSVKHNIQYYWGVLAVFAEV